MVEDMLKTLVYSKLRWSPDKKIMSFTLFYVYTYYGNFLSMENFRELWQNLLHVLNFAHS